MNYPTDRVEPDSPPVLPRVRKRMILTGILQGIGCRPTIFRLATRLGLGGWVVNTTSEVRIEIEGAAEQCERFERDLPDSIPFPGRIDTSVGCEVPVVGEKTFRIESSAEGKRSVTPIPPDVAVCEECVREMLDPTDPRYLYPFITCTLCGPRFTVVRAFPYDRERTSMGDFTMCSRCREEYETPADRRFHSQTNSCPQCGPALTLTDNGGVIIAGDPLLNAVRMLRDGKILAMKGIGGFHLAVDALNENAVSLLRERKGRAEKPFAVMMPDVATVRRSCVVNREEEELLTSPVAPIVLLEASGGAIAGNVAPSVGTLGVMLPYSPLHHLFFGHPGIVREERLQALVMTSGNRSEEPLARDNQEALDRLADLADAFLLHNREIVLRADDSIYRVIAGRATVFRRSRGLVPGELRLHHRGETTAGGAVSLRADCGCESPDSRAPAKVVLGTGGDLKSSLAVVKDDLVVPGPHVGDLASPVAQAYFKRSAEVLIEYLGAVPEILAVDPHPEYFSSTLAREMDVPVEEVFHHHAHAVSLLFQHGMSGPALFAVLDGTGYGTDGTIWGGEFLVADRETFTRLGHIGQFRLPGGEAAIREPTRILAGLLADPSDGKLSDRFLPLTGNDAFRAGLWLEAARKGINSPLTSSVGRLFDAAAAAVGFRRAVTFEGQAAMWLEARADREETGSYPIAFLEGETLVVDPVTLIQETARDILRRDAPERVAARFHNSIARLLAETLERLAERTGIDTVGLTGGCFQNRLLTERALALLEASGLRVLLHEGVPPNDGGIAVGQAVCARSRYERNGGT